MPPSTPPQKRRRKKRRHSAVKRKPASVRTPAARKSFQKRKRGAPKLPVTPQEIRSDEKRLRTESCALCPGYKPLSRKDLRHKNRNTFSLEKNNVLLTLMQCMFPDYNTTKRGVPVVLCESHFMKVKLSSNKPNEKLRFTSDFIASQNKKFKNAPAYRESSASTPLSKEHAALFTKPNYKYPLRNILENLPDIPAPGEERRQSPH